MQRESAGLILIFPVVSLGKRGGHGVLKLLKPPARFGGGSLPERRAQPDIVVVVTPEHQLAPGIVQTIEHLLVQELVAQASVE